MAVLQGHRKMSDVDIESPAIIRYGDLTRNEFFVPYPAPTAGATIENTGYGPLVIIKFFGLDCNLNIIEKNQIINEHYLIKVI